MAKKKKKNVTANTINNTDSTSTTNNISLRNVMLILSILVAIVAMGTVSITTTGNEETRSSVQSRKIDDEMREMTTKLTIVTNVDCTEENLTQFLHEKPVAGMHIVCFHKEDVQKDENRDTKRIIPLTTYSNMVVKNKFSKTIEGQSQQDSSSLWDLVQTQLVQQLNLPLEGSAPNKFPWSIFTTRGEHIFSAVANGRRSLDGTAKENVLREVMESGMVLVFTGGAWVWPGVREGFQREVELNSIMPGPIGTHNPNEPSRKIILETLSLRPLLFSVKNFIEYDECDRIQKLASPTMKYSTVTLNDADHGKSASEWRTSQSTFLKPTQDETLRNIELRTSSITRCPASHQEYTQVLRYGVGEKYVAHHDYFDPRLYQKDPSTLALIQNGRKNRLATVFWYLSDVEKGGHTNFPRYGGRRVFDFADCSHGIKVKPEKGKVIIFYSLDAAGDLDPLSMHAACPVEEGIKWAANKWIWNAPMNF